MGVRRVDKVGAEPAERHVCAVDKRKALQKGPGKVDRRVGKIDRQIGMREKAKIGLRILWRQEVVGAAIDRDPMYLMVFHISKRRLEQRSRIGRRTIGAKIAGGNAKPYQIVRQIDGPCLRLILS